MNRGDLVEIRHPYLTRYEPVGRVVEVHRNTAHVQLRRLCDGRLRLRWVKLSRVVPCS